MLSPKEESDVMGLMTSWERKGLEKGLEEGLERGKIAIAKKMILKGLEDSLILEVTRLPAETLAKLKKDKT